MHASRESGCAPSGVFLNAQDTTDPDGGLSFSWKVDDGDWSLATPFTSAGFSFSEEGSHTITLKVTDACGDESEASHTLEVRGPRTALEIKTEHQPKEGCLGKSYAASWEAEGGLCGSVEYRWTIAGDYPDGLEFRGENSRTLTLSGTPKDPGDFDFTITLETTNDSRPAETASASRHVTVHIEEFAFTTPAEGYELEDPCQDRPYDPVTFKTSCEDTGDAVTLSAEGLPAGMTFDPKSGTLQGTPTQCGPTTISIIASLYSPGGRETKIRRDHPVEVHCKPRIRAQALPSASACTAGGRYGAQLTADEGKEPLTWSLTGGSLPPGLALHASGEISGDVSPEAEPGTYTFTVEVKDDCDNTDQETFSIQVETGPRLTTPDLPCGLVGKPYEAQLEVSGGRPPYRFEVVDGQLPPGLELDADGRISGTPTERGDGEFEFVVAVGDAQGCVDSVGQKIEVHEMTFKTGIVSVGILRDDDDGVPSQFEVYVASQLVFDGEPKQGVHLAPRFIDQVAGDRSVVDGVGNDLEYLREGGGGGSDYTNANGVIFYRVLLDGAKVDDLVTSSIFIEIADQAFLKEACLEDLKDPARSGGIILDVKEDGDGITEKHLPFISSPVGVTRAGGGGARGVLAAAQLPDFMKGWQVSMARTANRVARFVIDRCYELAYYMPASPFPYIQQQVGRPQAHAIFVGFFMGLPNGVLAWGEAAMDDLKSIVIDLPVAAWGGITETKDFVLEVASEFTWNDLLFPEQAAFRVANKIAAKVAEKFAPIWQAAKAIKAMVVDTYRQVQNGTFSLADLANVLFPGFKDGIGAKVLNNLYKWRPGTRHFDSAAIGQMTGVFFACMALETTVDVGSSLVTGGSAAYARALAWASKFTVIRKFERIWKIIKASRHVIGTTAELRGKRFKVLMSFGSLMKDAAQSPKIDKVLDRFGELEHESGKLGGLYARHLDHFDEKEAHLLHESIVKVIEAAHDDSVQDTMLSLARIVDTEGRDLVFARDKFEAAGRGLGGFKKLQAGDQLHGFDLDRDLLGIDPANGKRIDGRGPSNAQLTKILSRADALSDTGRQGLAKFIHKTRRDGVPDPDAFRALDSILDVEPIADANRLFERLNDYDDAKAHHFVGHDIVGARDPAVAARRMAKFAKQELESPELERALARLDGFRESVINEIDKLVDAIPLTANGTENVLSDLTLAINCPTSTVTDARKQAAFEAFGKMRRHNTDGEYPSGCITVPPQVGSLEASSLLTNMRRGNAGHWFEALATSNLIDDEIVVDVVSLGQRFPAAGSGQRLIESDCLATLGPGVRFLGAGSEGAVGQLCYINYKYGYAGGSLTEIAGVVEKMKSASPPFTRACYASDTTRAFPPDVQQAIRDANEALNRHFETHGQFYIFERSMDAGRFPK
ncbi:MAG TPA: putative Ig domain-containing protein [Planctomycetota bacterium]|nr:putative Ig domain-containing protein [Planctomycetota bacterium]